MRIKVAVIIVGSLILLTSGFAFGFFAGDNVLIYIICPFSNPQGQFDFSIFWTAFSAISIIILTIVISYVTWKQNKRANTINKRLVESDLKKNYWTELIPGRMIFTTHNSEAELCFDSASAGDNPILKTYIINFHFNVTNPFSITEVAIRRFRIISPKNQVFDLTESPARMRTKYDDYMLMPTSETQEGKLFVLIATFSLPFKSDNDDLLSFDTMRIELDIGFTNIFNVTTWMEYSSKYKRTSVQKNSYVYIIDKSEKSSSLYSITDITVD